MYHTVWKLTALAAVVGIGVAVVVHAQRQMPENEVTANQPAAGDEGDDSNTLVQDDSNDASLPEQAEPELTGFDEPGLKATPASAKTGGSSNRARDIVKTSGIRSLNDTDDFDESTNRSRSRKGAGSDPFETSDDDSADEAPASRPSSKAQATSSRGAIDIVDVPDDDEKEFDEPRQVQAATSKNKRIRRPRAPVLTLDEPDAADSSKTSAETSEGSTGEGSAGKSGPRLLGATEDMDEDLPPRASSRAPAARIDTDDPFADEDPADSRNKFSRTPGDSGESETSIDDESEAAPKKPEIDSDSKPFKRDLAPLDLDEDEETPPSERTPPRRIKKEEEFPSRRGSDRFDDDAEDGALDRAPQDNARDFTERDVERAPAAPGRGGANREQLPAELGRTIEVEDPADEAPPAPLKTELPQITIEKIAPATAVLGRPMIYQIHVRNAGHTAAHQVVVEDVIPQDVKIDGSIPQAQLKENRLIWKLGTLAAGHEKKISVRVVPQSEGTIGGVATVNFAAEPKPASTTASPQLKFDVSAPRQVAVGTPVEFNFRVRNTGHIPASGVTIRNVLPAGLRHPDGDDLEYEIGQLPAGTTREIKLVLTAAQAGPTVNRVVVTADGNVAEEAQVQLDVVGPSLVVARDGPRRLFPNKTGVYSNTVTNPGLSLVSAVSIVETVPAGMEFVEAADGGTYNPAKRQVTWTVNQLAAAASKTVKVTLRSNARGAQVSVVRAFDPAGSSGETVGATHVSGVCALTIEIGEIPALIETGETVKVAVRILNRGSDTADNVRTTIAVPAGMQLLNAQGPTLHREVNTAPRNRAVRESIEVQFAPIAKIEPQADAVIELTLKAHTNGAARLDVQAQCDELPEPIRREEVTTIVSPQ